MRALSRSCSAASPASRPTGQSSFSKATAPASSRATFKSVWMSSCIRSSAFRAFPENSRTTEGSSGSPSMISMYMKRADSGVFSWWEISERVSFIISFSACLAWLLACSAVASCSAEANI